MMNIEVNKLKSVIYNNGLTYTELSDKSRVSRTTIYRIINQDFKASPSTIGKLAKVLNVKVEDLLQKEQQ